MASIKEHMDGLLKKLNMLKAPPEIIDAFKNLDYELSNMQIPLASSIQQPAVGADNINHPHHYTQGGIECIDALAAATVNLRGIKAVCTANAIKYLWRWAEKNGVEDLRKAQWYINRLIDEVEDGEE